ncbi:T3SS effector HopA1 family protein [Streptomyces sp. NPDC014646]|uniref:T3SS effector HopA1 family protein n=1 Tax=Streptomyces sp. NPDC014646 TaxID=3364877 RepID=UPI0036F4D5AD
MTAELAETLTAPLRTVFLSRDRRTATVGHRTVRAESAAELERELSIALYETFHAGREAPVGPAPLALHDAELEKALRGGVPHSHVHRVVPLAPATEQPGKSGSAPPTDSVLVTLTGVRVRVPSAGVTVDRAAGTARVAVPARRPTLSPGFFSALGTREPDPTKPLLRVYTHLRDARSSIPVWAAVLRRLENGDAAYQAKVLATPSDYPRRDALVVYLGEGSWHACHDIADTTRGMPGIAPDTSAFARRLAPGVSVAWEPDDTRPGMRGLSFGQHRAAVLARCLVEAGAGTEPTDPVRVAAALRAAGVDPAAPYRNAGSVDVPGPAQVDTAAVTGSSRERW